MAMSQATINLLLYVDTEMSCFAFLYLSISPIRGGFIFTDSEKSENKATAKNPRYTVFYSFL